MASIWPPARRRRESAEHLTELPTSAPVAPSGGTTWWTSTFPLRTARPTQAYPPGCEQECDVQQGTGHCERVTPLRNVPSIWTP
jgi:hypothetical protein